MSCIELELKCVRVDSSGQAKPVKWRKRSNSICDINEITSSECLLHTHTAIVYKHFAISNVIGLYAFFPFVWISIHTTAIWRQQSLFSFAIFFFIHFIEFRIQFQWRTSSKYRVKIFFMSIESMCSKFWANSVRNYSN